MKPVKKLKFMLTPNRWIKIEYKTSYSHGLYDIQLDTYLVYQKKFDKLLKDCLIVRWEEYDRN